MLIFKLFVRNRNRFAMLGVAIAFFLFFSESFDLLGVVVSFAVSATTISFTQNLCVLSVKLARRNWKYSLRSITRHNCTFLTQI